MAIKEGYKYNVKDVVSYKGLRTNSKEGRHYTKAELRAKHKADELMGGNRRDIKPPDWLDKRGKATFKRLVKDFEHFDILDIIDAELLAVYCDMHDKYVTLKKDIDLDKFHGFELRTKTQQLQKYSGLLLQYASKLGLSPESRKKICSKIATSIIEQTEAEKKFNV